MLSDPDEAAGGVTSGCRGVSVPVRGETLGALLKDPGAVPIDPDVKEEMS